MVPVKNSLRKLKQLALTICFEPVMKTYLSLTAKEGARGHSVQIHSELKTDTSMRCDGNEALPPLVEGVERWFQMCVAPSSARLAVSDVKLTLQAQVPVGPIQRQCKFHSSKAHFPHPQGPKLMMHEAFTKQ